MRHETAGLTLIELLVYSILLVSVLLIVGSIIISSLAVERAVRESTTSTSTAQLAATSIESGVRNATAVELIPVGSDQVLMARTAGADPSSVEWVCQAWYYSSGSGTIRMTTSASDATPVAMPTSEPASWALLASNIIAPTSGVIFTNSGNSVTIYFQATATNSEPVDIRSSSVLRAGPLESASCF